MNLSLKDIKHVADLAYIEIDEKQAEATLAQLSNIFSMIETMQSVDTSDIKPMSHSQSVSQRLREDIVTETDQRELFQSIAPQVQEGLYLVPQVIE
ncbi:aspartyl/glutamyl-tRNA(Asn/Gln) amidotransferase subunit C [Nitrosomonas sp. PY1]|uniref:Asp-tRNA(Asn)/Glu-tRNA(Gln) amidotransferase subunit GatC n=1 Tax=Nitrosomonas sp. PY1 TaxID=1803906 RepID=UPI001FC84314|nr:Asp-tRNA(Asn)/Glu-tRNA(Gln) amidotransferase subunit GatC [Nitrosomonas sp. PY1]GKS68641.1 aspartyl/glutamyl-tRNA(Asn/Gln) amidotransferase subunit C [Nitrosomonas sp. PY1]